MAIQQIRVRSTQKDTKGVDVLKEAQKLGIQNLSQVRTARVYRLEGITPKEAKILTQKLFCESINQEYRLNSPLITDTPHRVEVAYKPGVMNPEVASILKCAHDLNINLLAADSSTEYAFYGPIKKEEVMQIVNSLLVNKIVERIVSEEPQTLIIKGQPGPIKIVPIKDLSPEQLMALSSDKLFLTLQEMQIIQNYFTKLNRPPTDCELEIIAARWSEHCGHKTFKAKVIVDGQEKLPLFTRITQTAKKYFGKLVISAFKDNSGVIKFYEDQAICGKVETHNSPSAIEPYGGAMTGSGGVFRDILGTGQGAKVIISTDMFCFAPPDLDPSLLPPGTLHPDYLQRRVVAGVRDYGNRMGIPTNNGSVHYHPDFRAKPSVIVGAYGIIPEALAQQGRPRVKDLVVIIGGKTGRDGIHGATFSSGEMTDRTINVNSSAVQIGHAIEEKRVADAIIQARDQGLIRAITDCGAAGFSSAVGELGESTGVTIDISQVPLKYPGLSPWEIWLSESQERMVLAISPKNIKRFLSICQKYNVEVSVPGVFDGSHKLTVKYGDQLAADLGYDFLKRGLPQRVMKACWQKPQFNDSLPPLPTNWLTTLKNVLSHGNVCSKEPIVRQYDHGVQGTNALPPFLGKHFDGPSDAVVITPILGKPYGMVKSHGLNPILNRIDPYWGSVWAVTEAMANYVAVGGNPRQAVLVNNYIWPYPDEESMGSLDRCVDALVDSMTALKRPVVSGKDSLSSTYRGKDGQVIKIPPVLCISVFGRIRNVKKTVTSDIKKSGSQLYLIGGLSPHLGGSTYYDIHGLVGNDVPQVDLTKLPQVLKGIYQAIKTGQVLSCHDVSEGGIIGCLSEMAFGGDCGLKIILPSKESRPDLFLFNETAGMFVVEVKTDRIAHKLFGHLPHLPLGQTFKKPIIEVKVGRKILFSASTSDLKQAWQAPLRRIFS